MQKIFSLAGIQSLAVLYLIIWSISPPMEIDLIYRLIALAGAAIWFVILLIRRNPIEMEKEQVFALLFLVMVVAVAYLEDGSLTGVLRQIAFIMLVLSFIINYFTRDSWDEISWILPIVIVLFIVWNFKTFQALIDDPTIARKIVRDDETTYEYLRQGIGGYSLIYPQVCIFPAVLAWILKSFKNHKIYFILGCLWILSYLGVIFNAGYSIAIFTTAVSALILLFYKGNSSVKAAVIALGMFIIAMFAILYLDSFRNWLLEIFDGTAVAKKINDLLSSSDSGEAEGSIGARVTAYLGSVKTTFNYPVIGALWRAGGGGHSVFLDVLAKYGVFGLYVFAKMIYSCPNYYKSNVDDPFIVRTANATLVSIVIVSVLDSMPYSFMAVILLVLPLFFERIIEWRKAENENIMGS